MFSKVLFSIVKCDQSAKTPVLSSRFSGGRPSDVFLKSPTPWNDLYKRYGWSQVRRTLYPRRAKILGIRTEPTAVKSDDFINNSSVRAKYNTGISQQVQDTASSSWSKGGELSVGQEISYGIDVLFGSIGGSTSLSYTSSWGEETSKTRTVVIGSNSGVEVELDPGQAVKATLFATRGTMEVQIDYTASLYGDLTCNYPDTYRGHHFWRYDLNAVQNAGGLRKTVDSTEVLKIGFYSDAMVVVTDIKSRSTLSTYSVPIF